MLLPHNSQNFPAHNSCKNEFIQVSSLQTFIHKQNSSWGQKLHPVHRGTRATTLEKHGLNTSLYPSDERPNIQSTLQRWKEAMLNKAFLDPTHSCQVDTGIQVRTCHQLPLSVNKKQRLSTTIEDKHTPLLMYNHHIPVLILHEVCHRQFDMVFMGPYLVIIVLHHPYINGRHAIVTAVDAECAIRLIQICSAFLNDWTAHHKERLGCGVKRRYHYSTLIVLQLQCRLPLTRTGARKKNASSGRHPIRLGCSWLQPNVRM